jgi:uncharacterized damage-inducible protein DinB
MNISKPNVGSYPAYFDNYIMYVPDGNMMELMLTKHYDTIDIITSIDLETQHYRYEENKWNIKEIVQHLIDTERIFTYRALCIARGDDTPLPSFNENMYASKSHATRRDMNDLAREFSVVRASTIELYKSFGNDQLDVVGNANGQKVTPRAILYAILGHELHHMKVIQEKYMHQ